MQTVSCPGCGAPVEFRSHASVLAVCGFCKTTIAKDAGSVRNLGRMADVLEDYSPVQVGTSGVRAGRPFTVVGRIQLRYDAGIWNEWYLLFDDGATGWLGDSSGLYTLTLDTPLTEAVPPFEALRVGQRHPFADRAFVVAEIRTAQCIGGQGELPFQVGAGWQARVADLREGAHFLTLDYSDDAPRAYLGVAVTLEDLKAQLLRDDDAILAAAGKFRGKVQPLSCPSCGSAIDYLPGVTAHLVCPSCHAQVAADGPTAVVLKAADDSARVAPTLMLGAQANLAGKPFRILGFMRRQDDEGTAWTEYLMYNARDGFLWLVETDEGWARAKVLDNWPAQSRASVVQLENAEFAKLYDYQAKVTYVAGAFNWRVAVGDTVSVSEYARGSIKLACEASDSEMTWSKSQDVPDDQVRAWFGLPVAAKAAGKARAGKPMNYLWWLLGLNLIPVFAAFDTSWLPMLFGAAAIYLPARFLAANDKDAA
jgi:hypothetical protein